MAATLGKNLHLCFTKLKHRPFQPEPESESPNSSLLPLFPDYSTADSPPRQPSDSPDFATVCASSRFFFSSPGRSNSIVDSAESSDSPTSHKCKPPLSDQSESWDSPKVGGTVAVPTYSPDPYLDFRRSMEEMVAARGAVDVKADWDYLHELLLCYLALNPKSTHRFVVRAFADLLVSLLAAGPPSTAESMEE